MRTYQAIQLCSQRFFQKRDRMIVRLLSTSHDGWRLTGPQNLYKYLVVCPSESWSTNQHHSLNKQEKQKEACSVVVYVACYFDLLLVFFFSLRPLIIPSMSGWQQSQHPSFAVFLCVIRDTAFLSDSGSCCWVMSSPCFGNGQFDPASV
jgi:hypothetical protein